MASECQHTHTGHTNDAPIYENHKLTGSTHKRCGVWGLRSLRMQQALTILIAFFTFAMMITPPPLHAMGQENMQLLNFAMHHEPFIFYHLQDFYGHFPHFGEL